ncbi:hypothetical protein BT93_L5474 [Corymbia citriodora subsp. variegata]|uniref:Uncharacterized protein n=1 Tax=Corymbia citriodora subsp. variegata TaxID=360336 RepID=A0A8T0CS87_CORYI|nr:hypothetical protein BT93_L5474 [Corymbia citriodora subsp. variegata]
MWKRRPANALACAFSSPSLRRLESTIGAIPSRSKAGSSRTVGGLGLRRLGSVIGLMPSRSKAGSSRTVGSPNLRRLRSIVIGAIPSWSKAGSSRTVASPSLVDLRQSLVRCLLEQSWFITDRCKSKSCVSHWFDAFLSKAGSSRTVASPSFRRLASVISSIPS